MNADDLTAEEIDVAQRSTRRAGRAVALFSTWAAVTWLGPVLSPLGHWGWTATAIALVLYTALTLASLLSVLWGATRLVFRGVMRRVLGTYLAPFWLVALGSLGIGAVVWLLASRTAWTDAVFAAWIALGATFASLSGAYALARHREVRALRAGQRHVGPDRSGVGVRTWRQELGERLDAARSMRVE